MRHHERRGAAAPRERREVAGRSQRDSEIPEARERGGSGSRRDDLYVPAQEKRLGRERDRVRSRPADEKQDRGLDLFDEHAAAGKFGFDAHDLSAGERGRGLFEVRDDSLVHGNEADDEASSAAESQTPDGVVSG